MSDKFFLDNEQVPAGYYQTYLYEKIYNLSTVTNIINTIIRIALVSMSKRILELDCLYIYIDLFPESPTLFKVPLPNGNPVFIVPDSGTDTEIYVLG